MQRHRGRKYWRNLAAFTGGVLAVLALAAVAWYGYARTSAYVHPPRQVASGNWLRQHGVQPEQNWLITRDGIRLRAWYTAPVNGNVILVAHGHGGSIPEEYYLLFTREGYGVLAWEFRAHGESGGAVSTLGYNEALDVLAAVEFARSQPGVRHIGAWGGSMGAAAVIRAAAMDTRIEALVADSAYSTLGEVLDMRTSPMLRPLVRIFGRVQTGVDTGWMQPEKEIAKIAPRPVFIIQGLADTAIPQDSAERLFQAAGEPRLLWEEAGVGHLGMYPRYGEEYSKRLVQFFDDAFRQR